MSPKEPAVWPTEGYVPVVTRLPEALEDERKAREAAEREARIHIVAGELGLTVAETRKKFAAGELA